VARDFLGSIPVTLKVGAAVDTYTSDQRRYSKTWAFRPNGSTAAADRLASRFDVFDEAFIADSPTSSARRSLDQRPENVRTLPRRIRRGSSSTRRRCTRTS
jgi:hypothetical protein